MSTATQSLRYQKIIVFISVLLFGVKMFAWALTGSVSILTDALESTVNVVAGFIGLYSLTIAAKPKDEDHPYGHGKAEFISAAVEGSLIAVAGIMIIIKAADQLLNPQKLQELDQGMILIIITAVINYIVGSICRKAGKINKSLALEASGKHLLTDTYSTIGIIIGLLLIFYTGLYILDSIIAIGFALFIIYNGYKIIQSSLEGIMDKADVALLDNMVQLLNENRRENWIDIHNTRFIKYGSVLHLDAHLTVPWYLNVHEAHDEIDNLSSLIRSKFGESLELFVHSDGCLPFSCKICSKSNCTYRKHQKEDTITWTVKNISTDQKHGSDLPL